MKVNVGLTITDEDWEKIEKAMKEEALGNPDCHGNTWFKTEEEYEEWAGDLLDTMLIVAFKATGIELE